MDLNDYWQENKRFVTVVLVGLVAFLIGYSMLSSKYQAQIDAKRVQVAGLRGDLRKPMFKPGDLRQAEAENEALKAAVGTLTEAAGYDPRDEFHLDAANGSSSNQYVRALTRVREELIPRANRANVRLDETLGMPTLSPTREAEIQRYLEALDLVDSTVRMAIDSRVKRVERIQVRLDPGLNSREGLGRIERTRISLTVTGDARSLQRLLTVSQRPGKGRMLRVHELEVVPSKNKPDEVRLDLTLVVPRLFGVGTGGDGTEEG